MADLACSLLWAMKLQLALGPVMAPPQQGLGLVMAMAPQLVCHSMAPPGQDSLRWVFQMTPLVDQSQFPWESCSHPSVHFQVALFAVAARSQVAQFVAVARSPVIQQPWAPASRAHRR